MGKRNQISVSLKPMPSNSITDWLNPAYFTGTTCCLRKGTGDRNKEASFLENYLFSVLCHSKRKSEIFTKEIFKYLREWRRQWHPTPVLLPGKSHGQKSLVGCSPWGHTESDMTERLHSHFLLSCIGEGNDNPLQFSCLENPRDRDFFFCCCCLFVCLFAFAGHHQDLSSLTRDQTPAPCSGSTES